MRMCSILALISCNVALRRRREGGGGRDMYAEKESGTLGSTVGEEREGRSAHSRSAHTHNIHTHTRTHT